MSAFLKNIDYKKKFYLLIAGFFVFSLTSYQMAVHETLALRKQHRQLSQKIFLLDDAPHRIESMEKSLQNIEATVGTAYGNSLDIQEDLLNDLTPYCQRNSLIIREVPPLHYCHSLGYRIETCNIVFQGRFIPLLKLLNHLENDFPGGRVISADFIKKKDLKTKKTFLVLSVFVQNVMQQQNESDE